MTESVFSSGIKPQTNLRNATDGTSLDELGAKNQLKLEKTQPKKGPLNVQRWEMRRLGLVSNEFRPA